MIEDLITDIVYCVYGDLMPLSKINLDRNHNNVDIEICFHEEINYGGEYKAVYVGLNPFNMSIDISKNNIYQIINNLLLKLSYEFGVMDYYSEIFWIKIREVLNKHWLNYNTFSEEEYCQKYLKFKMEKELKK